MGLRALRAQQAAMVANQNTLATRAAMREIAKVYGIPAGRSAKLSRSASATSRLRGRRSLSTTVKTWATQVCRALQLRTPWPDILFWSVQLQGHFRNLGLHPGGVVLVPDEIRRYVPVEISASGLPVIQWEKDQTEDAGLVKIDLLGNRSLAVIRDALAAITQQHGPCHRLCDLGPDQRSRHQRADPARRHDGVLLRRVPGHPAAAQEAVGRHAACQTSPGRCVRVPRRRLLASSGRPRNVFADEFVRRAHGQRYRSLHPLLDEVLAETLGIMVYQEDVMKVAVALGGFSVEDGDQLRKVLSKKHKARQLRDYQRQFYEGASARACRDTSSTPSGP